MNDGKCGKKLSKREEQLRREDVCLRSGWGRKGIDKEPREQNVKSADQLKKGERTRRSVMRDRRYRFGEKASPERGMGR
ncbi:hypothetical protein BGZ61DRAFT_6580 [Ilyonectria robusta]|uniref:uncharacterized protein n=1 Tax=Ilyonectria robusta TaxID=1079257 RepID=UPI001E8EB3BE|nr:uncharacterized protein BGZ61DRAFT_6580 [Ilyonectria robusta]KAH8736988.1 hypothetical protein BGZ61DRAFT_6580 [Ilyonectria robusta]